MLSPAPMELFCSVILARDIDRATALLVRREALHLVRIRDLEEWAKGLAPAVTGGRLDRSRDLQKRLLAVIQAYGGGPVAVDPDGGYSVPGDLEDMARRLAAIEQRLGSRLKQKKALLGQLADQEAVLERLKVLGPGDIGRAARGRYTFLDAVLVRAEEAQRVLLERGLASVTHAVFPFSTREDDRLLLVLALKRDACVVEKALDGAGVRRAALPDAAAGDPGEAGKNIGESLIRLKEQVRILDARTARDAGRLVPVLGRLYAQIFSGTVMAEAQGYFQRTERTCLITGWLPRARRKEIGLALREAVAGRCYVHGERPGNVTAVRAKRAKVPVLLDNPRWLQPFEMIVTNYDMPEYGSVDPTLFVAVTFFLMFGVMFGDLGQGLVLLAAGVGLAGHRRVSFARAGVMMAYGGVSAALFGALYGAFFGLEGVIPALWKRPMDNVSVFIPLAIAFGALMISLGVGINLVNAVRSRDVLKGVFGSSGLIGGLLYWTVLVMAVRYFVFKADPVHFLPLVFSVWILGLLFFLKAPVERLLVRRERMFPQGFFTYLLETGIEVLEIMMGYAANTLSYIRLAAFALAHAGLFWAVFSLADLVKDAFGGGAGPVAVIIAGNILILFFEGVLVAIQGIRLEYYEFFSRFFTGGGKAYRPFGFGASI